MQITCAKKFAAFQMKAGRERKRRELATFMMFNVKHQRLCEGRFKIPLGTETKTIDWVASPHGWKDDSETWVVERYQLVITRVIFQEYHF